MIKKNERKSEQRERLTKKAADGERVPDVARTAVPPLQLGQRVREKGARQQEDGTQGRGRGGVAVVPVAAVDELGVGCLCNTPKELGNHSSLLKNVNLL